MIYIPPSGTRFPSRDRWPPTQKPTPPPPPVQQPPQQQPQEPVVAPDIRPARYAPTVRKRARRSYSGTRETFRLVSALLRWAMLLSACYAVYRIYELVAERGALEIIVR